MQNDYLPIVSIIFRTPEECDFSPLTLPFLKACKEQHNVLCLFLNNQRTEYQGTNSHIFQLPHKGSKSWKGWFSSEPDFLKT